MAVRFKKLRPNRIFQNVVDQVQEAIVDGRLKPGDQLPPEMKLKEMFDTSRGTIREALRVLEQKGLIDIKTGVAGGAMVRDIDHQAITEGLDLLVQSQKVSFEHLVEFREGVEGIVAALAAERATATEMDAVFALLEKARALLPGHGNRWDQLLALDVKIHIAIAKIAANPIFLAVLRMVHENILNAYDWSDLKHTDILKENFDDMAELLAAIQHGEANEARALAQYHVRKFHEYVSQETSTDISST